MQLQPKRPPGRADRKAAAYACEIVRLRAEGYTYEAIREALAEVGIALSECALRREVRRHEKRTIRAVSDSWPTSQAPAAPSLPVERPLATGPPSSKNATGREIAEAFFNANHSNPLLPPQGDLMRLAVINFSGNVGKTTVARHLLAPRIPGCQVVAVESINADDGQSVTIRGRQFAQLQEFLQSAGNVVIDIGASNVEELLKLMRRYRDSQEDFDGFIVPTVPARKQQQDTAATLAELARIGVPPDRLRLVFNQIDDDNPIERTFETLLAYCASSGVVQPRPAAFMSFNEVYALVRGAGQSLAELAADSTDYKAAIAKAGVQSDKLALAQHLAIQRLARGVIPELDACFEALDLHRLAHESSEAEVPAG